MSFRREEIERARNTNLVHYLRGKGFNLEPDDGNGNYRIPGYGGLIVKNGMYSWQSHGTGGNAIEFVMEFFGLSFVDAVNDLLGYAAKAADSPQVQQREATKRELVLPKNPKDSRAIWRYLRDVRKLPDQVIGELLARGLLYQDTRCNCVFGCLDRQGTARSAALRGTRPADTFKGQALSSDANYGWVWTPTGSAPFYPTVVTVTESAVDAISLVLYSSLRASPILSLNGAGMWGALETFLCEWPEVKTVVLALDSDEMGKEATARYKAELEKGGYAVALFVPQNGNKDWNEELLAVSAL